MEHIIYFNQDYIHHLSDELINDIKMLFKVIYKDDYDNLFIPNDVNKERYITYFKNRYYNDLQYDENFFDNQIIIEQLDNNGIIFHFPDFTFIINDKMKNDFIVLNNEDYNYILLMIIMLCVKHNIINNNWLSSIIQIDEYIMYEYGDSFIKEYYNELINRCKNTLCKIGYKHFNCIIDVNHYFILDMNK